MPLLDLQTATITANGSYTFPAMPPGSLAVLTVTGTFGGGTVTVSFVSAADVFSDVHDASKTAITGTTDMAWEVRVPPSGKLGVKLAGATNPSLKVGICLAQ